MPTDEQEVIATTIGARQGCTCGAIVHNVIYERALEDARTILLARGIPRWMNFDPSAPPWEVAEGIYTPSEARESEGCLVSDIDFVDGVVLLLVADSAARLLQNLAEAIDVIVDRFAHYGLRVNLAKGKTEATIKLAGHQSRKLNASLGKPGKKRLITPNGNDICVVEEYVHLGTIQHQDGDTVPDAKRKAVRCDDTYTKLMTNIFGNNGIRTSVRLSLASSLCMSRLSYGTDTYVRRHRTAETAINRARMRVYRRIDGCPLYGPGGPTDAEVQARLGILPTNLWLLRKRLMALPEQLHPEAPKLLQMLRRQPGTVAQAQLAQDLQLAWWAFPALHWLPDPSIGWQTWLCAIGSKDEWKAAMANCDVRVADWDAEVPTYTSAVSAGDVAGGFACDLCPKEKVRICRSAAALASHKRCAHGAMTKERELLKALRDELRCPACGAQFESARHTADHMREASCRAELKLREGMGGAEKFKIRKQRAAARGCHACSME